MKRNRFEGWYLKHQKGSQMLAFIPGRAESGAFVQMISNNGARQFPVPEVKMEGNVIRAGKCLFSSGGCRIDLPGVWGELSYGPIQPLVSDIMGPFRFLPMECRHGVLSMAHSVTGSVTVEGERLDFDGGTGYAEMDRGASFPEGYLWVQCNTFPEPCALMAAVATIPLGGLHFRGCICAVLHGGLEYRFATYCGVRVLAATGEHLCLRQGKFLLEMDMQPRGEGHALAAPMRGRMSGVIRECCNAGIRLRLWEDGKPVMDLSSETAAYEFVNR